MKKHFDFVINNTEDIKTVIRFYPCRSHVHGFDENIPPNKWENVYKTYLTFSILNYYWEDKPPSIMFTSYMDEGEGLRYLRDYLDHIINKNDKRKYDLLPFGSGAEWIIERNRNIFSFYIFSYFKNNGFRFGLNRNRIQDFYDVLNDFLEYMLKHSEVI